MNRRKIRPWLPFLVLAAVVAVLAVVQLWRRATTADAPPNSAVRASMSAPFLEAEFRGRGLNVTAVACADRPDATYLFASDPDPKRVEGVPAEREFADRWRGVVLFDPHGGGSLIDDDPNEFRMASFRVFGDPDLVAAIRGRPSGAGPLPDRAHPAADASSK